MRALSRRNMTTMEAPSRADNAAAPARRVPWWRPRTALVVALVLSLGIHFALSLVPDELPSAPDEIPLTATLQELPPPPVASAPPVAKPKPKPRPRPAPAARRPPGAAAAPAKSR